MLHSRWKMLRSLGLTSEIAVGHFSHLPLLLLPVSSPINQDVAYLKESGQYSITHYGSKRILRATDAASVVTGSPKLTVSVPILQSSQVPVNLAAIGSFTQPAVSAQTSIFNSDPSEVWTVTASGAGTAPSFNIGINTSPNTTNALARTPDAQSRSWTLWQYITSKKDLTYLLYSTRDAAFLALNPPGLPATASATNLWLCSSQDISKPPAFSRSADPWIDPCLFWAATNNDAFEKAFGWMLWSLSPSFSYPVAGEFQLPFVVQRK